MTKSEEKSPYSFAESVPKIWVMVRDCMSLLGAGLAVHKASKSWLSCIPDNWFVRSLSWMITMLFVSFLWVFFRAESWTDSWLIIQNIFTNFRLDYIPVFVEVRYVWCIMMALIIAAHAVPSEWWTSLGRMFVRSPWCVKLLVFVVVVQLVIQFMSEDVSPFIYFQF